MSRSADIIFTGARVFTSHAAKFFMDVVWESYTVLTLEPYADDPQHAWPQGIYSAEHFTRGRIVYEADA